jgi:hypothetical protein
LEEAKKHPQRIRIVDASQTNEAVQQQMREENASFQAKEQGSGT